MRWDLSERVSIDYAYDFSEIDGPQHYYQTTSSTGNAIPANEQRSDTGSWDGGVTPSHTEISGHSFIVSIDTISIDRKEQIENPINIGSTVIVTNFPIKTLIGTAISVEIKPVIAAPIPAI